MRYVLYEGENGDMLFTKEEHVKKNPNLLKPFKKTPTIIIEAENDNDAVAKLNANMMMRGQKKA